MDYGIVRNMEHTIAILVSRLGGDVTVSRNDLEGAPALETFCLSLDEGIRLVVHSKGADSE